MRSYPTGQDHMKASRSAFSGSGLRLILGFAVLPPAMGLVMFLTCLVLWGVGAWVFDGRPSFEVAIGIGFAVSVIAALVTVFGAVPAVMWLIRRRNLSLRTLLLAGMALGNAPLSIIVAGILMRQAVRGNLLSDAEGLWFGWYVAIRSIFLGLWFGIAAAVVLWAVGVRGTDWNALTAVSPTGDSDQAPTRVTSE
jgi:hypothetical protein